MHVACSSRWLGVRADSLSSSLGHAGRNSVKCSCPAILPCLQVSVPALCQRLTLHDVDEKFSESLLQHMIPYHLQRVGKPIEDLSKSHVAEAQLTTTVSNDSFCFLRHVLVQFAFVFFEEVKAFRNPPQMVVSCLTVVLALVGSSRLIGHC